MKLIIALDLSGSTDKIVKKGEELARALSAKVWLLHVALPDPDFVGFDTGPETVRDSWSKEFHSEHKYIQELADRLRKAGIKTTALLVQGPTVETILKEASKLQADMIVMGSHGKGAMYQVLVGSVSEGVLKKSQCPVLIIPTHERI